MAVVVWIRPTSRGRALYLFSHRPHMLSADWMPFWSSNVVVFAIFGLVEGETIHHSFLKAIEIPLRDEEHITFGPGADGFPAFVLFHGHDIKIPHKLLLPDKLYSSFSILVTVKPENNEGKVGQISYTLFAHDDVDGYLLCVNSRWLSVCCGRPTWNCGPVWCANQPRRTWAEQHLIVSHPSWSSFYLSGIENRKMKPFPSTILSDSFNHTGVGQFPCPILC